MAFGFTPRQAAFLTTVMVHAGVCLPRQYTTFCRIVFGHTTRDFFARLVRDRFATAYPCWRRRGGSLYHVHHKALYRAIGEPDNRHRRPVTVARAVERLMLLDVVLGERDLNWLATEREKVAHFTGRNINRDALPAFVLVQAGARIIRHFPDKFPIGLRVPSDEVVFVYLVTSGNAQEVQRFLVRHKPLFRHLSRLTIRFVFPAVLAGGQPQVERLATAFFSEPPIRHAVLEEFRHYCRARRAIETSCEPEISSAALCAATTCVRGEAIRRRIPCVADTGRRRRARPGFAAFLRRVSTRRHPCRDASVDRAIPQPRLSRHDRLTKRARGQASRRRRKGNLAPAEAELDALPVVGVVRWACRRRSRPP